MISELDRLMMRVEALIRLDGTELHVDFDNLVHTLSNYKFLLRPARFEVALQDLLSKFVGKDIPPQQTKNLVARAILELAGAMNMRKDALISHYHDLSVKDVGK